MNAREHSTGARLSIELGGVNATYYVCPKCHVTSHTPHDVKNMYCGRCHTFAEQLRDEPVTTFAHLTKRRLTHRDCFSLAILTLLDSPDNADGRLVHGWVLDCFDGRRHVEHAWCEFPATAIHEDGSEEPIVVVVDYTQLNERAVILPTADMYRVCQVRDTRRFTLEEAIAYTGYYGCDGPWPIVKSPPKGST